MASKRTSALGLALNGKSASVDIPKVRDTPHGLDNLTAVPAASSKKHRGMLPTPPQSLSPNMAMVGMVDNRVGVPVSPTSAPVDSDMDLQDGSLPPQPYSLNSEVLDRLGNLDSAGAITPGLLAKHHLPSILLSNGPLAIRHIMGHLTTSVPGFSRIAPAKARRLVVAALEGRGTGGEGGGLEGEVVFEKVGWGRWDARVKGQPSRERQNSAMTPPGSLPSSFLHGAMQVPAPTAWRHKPDRLASSLTARSVGFSHSEMEEEHPDMLEHEADKMSLDGNDEGYASSEAPEPMDEDLGEGEVTDEEDWASIGAEALRARSLPSSGRQPSVSGRLYQPISYSSASRQRSSTPADVAYSVPVKRPLHAMTSMQYSNSAALDNSQERAAIEALLSLGHL